MWGITPYMDGMGIYMYILYMYIYSIDLDSLLSWFIGILEMPHY